MADCIFHLVGHDAQQELIAEVLLTVSGPLGFSRVPVFLQGARHRSLTKEEEVLGMCHMVRFDLLIAQDRLAELLARLAGCLQGMDIDYWVTPVIAAGRIE